MMVIVSLLVPSIFFCKRTNQLILPSLVRMLFLSIIIELLVSEQAEFLLIVFVFMLPKKANLDNKFLSFLRQDKGLRIQPSVLHRTYKS